MNLFGFDGLRNPHLDGITELFYMIGFTTMRIKYNENTRVLISLEVGGRSVPVDSPEIIAELNKALDDARKQLGKQKEQKPGIMIDDIHMSSFQAVSKRDPDGTVEVFGLVGFNTVRIKYNETTGIVSLIEVNGHALPLDDRKVVDEINKALDGGFGNGNGNGNFSI